MNERTPRLTLLLGLLFTLLILHAGLVLATWARWIVAPHRVGGVEVLVLNAVMGWRSGQIPYTFLRRIPAEWSPYGPLYQALCAALPLSPGHPYLTGRLLSLLSVAGCGALLLVWSARRGWAAAGGIAALLLLTARPIFVFGPIYRVDMLAIALSLAGYLLLVRSKSRAADAGGLLLLVLALHTKLTAVAGPLAFFLCTWPLDRRRAVMVTAAWAVLTGLTLGAFQLLTHGAYLYDVGLLADGTRLAKVFDMMTRPVTSSPLWVAAVVVGLRAVDAETRRLLRPELWYCAVTLLLAGITGSHPGSSWNYLIDFYVALALLSGSLLACLHHCGLRAPLTWSFGLLLAQALFSLWYTGDTLRPQNEHLRGYAASLARARAVVEPLVRRHARLAVIGSERGNDALLALGYVNPVVFPPLRLLSERDALLQKALRTHQLDLVLDGPQLRPWQPSRRRWSAPDEE